MAAPVMKSEAGAARNTAMPARSAGCAPAAGRRAHQHHGVEALDLLARAAGEVGIDPARQDGVDLDVVLGPAGGERLGELHDAALGGAVGRREAGAEDGQHGADVDDLAAAGLLHHGIDRLASRRTRW